MHHTVRLSLLIALLLLLLSPGGSAQATTCRVQVGDITRIEPARTYDPFGDALPEYHRFSVRFLGGLPCRIVVGIDQGRNGDRVMVQGRDRLEYQLYKDAALTQPVTDLFGSENGLFATVLDAREDTAEFQFFSRVTPGQMAGQGTYTDQVRISVYQSFLGILLGPIAVLPVSVRTRVKPVVQASVVLDGVKRDLRGMAGTLDLGDLTQRGSGQFDLEVLGNGAYDLALESENRGQLIAPGVATGIPYQLTVDGYMVNPGSKAVLRLDGLGLQRHQVLVSAGGVERALAGTYRDNLILTVTAR
ncbi:spore coat protein U domain-containing protein [Oleisolibacter albus]|uniref:spore coat protein U domain-containing protein n=1 Tax=Oleisolibacter albus TaxID=2171757 RepID=UPI00138FA9F0|nr:spore coat protein U domain-containing protein [Oleisolibacter albus]